MMLRTLTVGPVSCNCCIVACPETREAVIIDPGGHAEEILAEVQSMEVNVIALLHTHGHFDHVLATGAVAAATGAPVLIHRDDERLYQDLPGQGRVFGFRAERPPAPSGYLEDEGTLAIGTLSARVLHVPGHSPGSVAFFFQRGVAGDERPILFAGDTLFAESVGRTDFPGGSFPALVKSIREKLYELPAETRVIPGHGGPTTIAHERAFNPFIRAVPDAAAS